MSYFFTKQKGFTMVEILIVIILCAIIAMAALGLYLASDKVFKKMKATSDVLEEMRSAMATLDFVFSRWGVGVPCKNNNCTIGSSITPCDATYPPSDPLCVKCNSGDLNSGCSDIEFYANLYGYGFVVNVNGTQTDLISCRLSTDKEDNYYYIWQGEKVVNYNGSGSPPIYKLSKLIPHNQDCIENYTGSPNAKSSTSVIQADNATSTYTLQPGDIIIRVPHKVRLYVDSKSNDNGYWLYLEKTDMATYENSTTKVAKVKDLNSFKVYYAQGHTLKLEIEFQSQSKPEKVLKIERYFAR